MPGSRTWLCPHTKGSQTAGAQGSPTCAQVRRLWTESPLPLWAVGAPRPPPKGHPSVPSLPLPGPPQPLPLQPLPARSVCNPAPNANNNSMFPFPAQGAGRGGRAGSGHSLGHSQCHHTAWDTPSASPALSWCPQPQPQGGHCHSSPIALLESKAFFISSFVS